MMQAVQNRSDGIGGLWAQTFPLLLIACWLAQFMSSDVGPNLPEQVMYWLFVGPSAVFVSLGVAYLFLSRNAIARETWILIVFAGLIVGVSVARRDLNTILAMGLMSMMLIVLIHYRLRVPTNLINILFIASIPLNELFYRIGLSPYSVIPGWGDLQLLSWRVSILPHVATGGFFAVYVLLLNGLNRDAFLRRTCIALALYFVLFTGIRTVVISGLVAGAYLAACYFDLLRSDRAKAIALAVALGLVVLLVYKSNVILEITGLRSGITQQYLVRDDNPYGFVDPEGRPFTVAIRAWMSERQLELAMRNPLVGVGTYDLAMMQSGYELFDNMVSGSETYLTGMLGRIGAMGLLLLYVIFLGRTQAPPEQRELTRCSKAFLFLAMVFYGSFITPYDFIFLILMGTITGGVTTGWWWRGGSSTRSRGAA